LEEAGTLASLIPEDEKYITTTLRIIGPLNGDDIRFIREMAGRDVDGNETAGRLADLDISEATIVEGGGAYYRMNSAGNYTENDVISYHMFRATNLKCIYLPTNITRIGYCSFLDCTSLKYITIGNVVTMIEEQAFKDCTSLIEIVLPNSVTTINNYAFWNCTSLKEVNIPTSITSLSTGIFRGCSSLASIVIPETVTAVNTQAFYECTSLVEVTCKATTPPEFPTAHPVFGTYELNYIPSSVLYVPAGCASAYKNSEWNGYFSIIKAEGESDSTDGGFNDMPNIEW
jgi:hypothetical protein